MLGSGRPPVGKVRFAQHRPWVVARLFHEFHSQTKFIIESLFGSSSVYVKESAARARPRMYGVASPRSPVGFTRVAGDRVARGRIPFCKRKFFPRARLRL